MPPLPLHLSTPSASQLRHDLVPAAIGASIGLFAILVGFIVFIVFWVRGTPRLNTRGALLGQRRTGSKRLRKRMGDGLEKIVEEGEGEGAGDEVEIDRVLGEGRRGGGRVGRRQEDNTARMSEGEMVTMTDGGESGDGWEVVRSSSATQEVVEAVGRKGEARAWWKGGKGWWR